MVVLWVRVRIRVRVSFAWLQLVMQVTGISRVTVRVQASMIKRIIVMKSSMCSVVKTWPGLELGSGDTGVWGRGLCSYSLEGMMDAGVQDAGVQDAGV